MHEPMADVSNLNDLRVILSLEQAAVLRLADLGVSVFITGKAGTGKTTLLKSIVQSLSAKYGEECVFVTSSTGASACHIEGTTVHSFGGIGYGEGTIEEIMRKMYPRPRQRWKVAKALIIDEISMLPPEIFDLLEEIARRIRKSSFPFGGIQIIVCGDFYQLSPVYKNGEEVKYCFEAKSWKNVIQRSIELKTVFRQREAAFLKVLEDVRHGLITPDVVAILRTRVHADLSKFTGTKFRPPRLRSLRETVARENEEELKKLTGDGVKSTAIDTATNTIYLNMLKSNCQAPDVLYMREGAQVLLLRNMDVLSGLCNGAVGVIKGFENGQPLVEFASGVISVQKMKWEIKVGKEVMASRYQFPLILGWSVTIHKSQGMTLDCADVELSRLFAAGQGYTALSRVRSLDGLSIDAIPTVSSIATNQKVEEYYKNLQ